MAITKKFKASFDFTFKLSTELEANLAEQVKELAKRASIGAKMNGLEEHMLVQALTYGPDAVIETIIRAKLRESIKEMFEELGDTDLFKVSPTTVRVIR